MLGLVLAAFGGDTSAGRKGYKAQIAEDLAKGFAFKKLIVGQSILGGKEFVARVKETFLDSRKEREQPAAGKLFSYIASEKIIAQISAATGKVTKDILHDKGEIRQLAMDLLYRFGGMKNPEIGELMGIDYSTVSQGRKRLAEKLGKNRKLAALQEKIEENLSRIKI